VNANGVLQPAFDTTLPHDNTERRLAELQGYIRTPDTTLRRLIATAEVSGHMSSRPDNSSWHNATTNAMDHGQGRSTISENLSTSNQGRYEQWSKPRSQHYNAEPNGRQKR
jgi:hypothetical protein